MWSGGCSIIKLLTHRYLLSQSTLFAWLLCQMKILKKKKKINANIELLTRKQTAWFFPTLGIYIYRYIGKLSSIHTVTWVLWISGKASNPSSSLWYQECVCYVRKYIQIGCKRNICRHSKVKCQQSQNKQGRSGLKITQFTQQAVLYSCS